MKKDFIAIISVFVVVLLVMIGMLVLSNKDNEKEIIEKPIIREADNKNEISKLENKEEYFLKINSDNYIDDEEKIDIFIKAVKNAKEEISITIEGHQDDADRKVVLKYIPGQKTISEIEDNEELDDEKLKEKYGYFEYILKGDEDYVKTFNAYDYFPEKVVTDVTTKVIINSRKPQDYFLIICQYNTIVKDITNDVLNSRKFVGGNVFKVEDDKLYFLDDGKKMYLLQNNEELDFKDGRTNKNYPFNEIRETYVIDIGINKEVFIYKNLYGEELKKELLYNLTLEDGNRPDVVNCIEIKNINKIGNNEAIVDIGFRDLVNLDNDEYYFETKVKFTKNTTYYSKGHNIYDIDTLEEAKSNINSIILDAKTLNNEYPEVLVFESTDN